MAATAGVALACLRRSRAAAIGGLLLVGLAAGAGSAAADAGEGGLVRAAAARVPRCVMSGRVLERSAGTTLIGSHRLECEGVVYADAGVVAVRDESARAGSLVEGEGWLVPLGSDAYGEVLRRHGAAATFDPDELRTVRPPDGLFGVTAALHGSLLEASEPAPERVETLLAGLTVGDTSAMDPATEQAFRDAGLAHLVAVSGSNVAIVVGTVFLAARSVSLVARTILAAGALIVYVLLVGPEASVLRAATMGALGLVGIAAGVRGRPLHLLGLAAALLLIARPGLVFSVGLHMSIAATAGILLWAPPLTRRLRLPRPLAVALSVTVAAQLAVAPLVALTFGTVSLVAPASNVLAAPAVAPATVLGLAAALTGTVWEPAGRATVLFAEPFVRYILWVADVSSLPGWASVPIGRGPAWALSALVALVAAATLRRRAPASLQP